MYEKQSPGQGDRISIDRIPSILYTCSRLWQRGLWLWHPAVSPLDAESSLWLFFCQLYTLRLFTCRVFNDNTHSDDLRVKMTSSNGKIFHVTGHLCGEFTGHRWIPSTKASDAELWCFFDLHLNKRLSKQSWVWWFATLPRPLWRQRNVTPLYHHHHCQRHHHYHYYYCYHCYYYHHCHHHNYNQYHHNYVTNSIIISISTIVIRIIIPIIIIIFVIIIFTIIIIMNMTFTYIFVCHYNIRRSFVSNKIVDHSDVVSASPLGAAPTTASFFA